jgi:predicted ribosome quality control (RQC) complex YloA/Tae2 family protein
MKLSMSSLDIMVCARELKNAIGARVDKVYELEGVFVLEMRTPGKGRLDLLIEPGRRVHLTTVQYKFPKQPAMYAMLLRKHLGGAQLVGIEQPDFERILELRFRGREERVLIAEFFGVGNLVLCDGERKIIQPYRSEEWRHRLVKAGERYKYPPSRADIGKLDAHTLREAVAGAPDIVRGLATNLNIGGQLAEEICARAGIAKSSAVDELSDPQLKDLLAAAAGLFSQEPAPNIVYDDGEVIDVLPFDFAMYGGRRMKRFSSFNEALDEYFSAMKIKESIVKQKKKLEDELKAIRSRLAEQEAHFAELEREGSELKLKADLIKAHHAQLDDALRRLLEIRRRGGWQVAVKEMEKARADGEGWTKLIRKVDVKAGAVDVELRGQEIRLDVRKSAFENASRLYDRYKRLWKKVEGAKEALEATKKELENLLAAGAVEVPQPAVRRRRKMKWFERFRWFISSDGLLVIAGRDASTNREVVEKHMEGEDRYLHADIVGAPHVVVKTGGREVPEATLREAAEFAAMHSRAWREGLGSLDVYWVMPSQVSRRAPSGEYLPRGAYIIEGKRNFLKVAIEAAVGVTQVEGDQLVMCGPASAVERHSKVAIRIVPGRIKKSDLSRELQAKLRAAGFDVQVDELMRVLPPGKGEIKK